MDYSDKNLQRLHKYSVQFLGGRIPAYVKTASEDLPVSREPIVIFADPLRRSLPTHTKSATFLSSLYFYGDQANGEGWEGNFPRAQAEARLLKAAQLHGIAADVAELRQAVEKCAHAPELQDSDFAVVRTAGDERVRLFPVNSAASVEKSADALFTHRIKHSFAVRHEAAKAILAKAAAFDAKLTAEQADFLICAAGMYPNVKGASAGVLVRSKILADASQKDTLQKLASVLTKLDPSEFVKVCELLDNVDREVGQDGWYARGMPLPEQILFCGLAEKVAANSDVITLVNGSAYDINDLGRAGLAPFGALPEYRDAVSDGDKLDLTKVAVILPTIPRNDARLLDMAFEAVGVRKLTEKSAGGQSTPDFLDSDKWLEFAQRQQELTGYRPNMHLHMSIPLHHNQRPKTANTPAAMRPLTERMMAEAVALQGS